MKYSILAVLILLTSLLSMPAFSQTEEEPEALGLPGDNLDLFAVLDLFQKSPTIEDFEKKLNDTETGINNLDLNLDEKVDFIKVKTEQDGDDFTFILQVDITEDETQDVAVVLLSKDNEEKVTMQIVGDQDLYGKDYVVEPAPATPAVTPNPAYTGTEPVSEAAASTTVVVVESAPIVQYVYSPVYVPYYPPYYYGYYPPYFMTMAVISVGIYRHNNYYHHHGYHGGYGNTVVIRNTNHYNNYNGNRPSNGSGNRPSGGGDRLSSGGERPGNGSGNRPSQQPSNPSGSARPSNPNVSQQPSRPSTNDRYTNPSPSTRQSGASPSTRQSGASPSTRQSGASPSTRQSGASPSTRQSSGSYSGGGRSGGSYSSGANRSSGRGGSYSGGGRSGASRGGGGRR